jgi:hypothetical protein
VLFCPLDPNNYCTAIGDILAGASTELGLR